MKKHPLTLLLLVLFSLSAKSQTDTLFFNLDQLIDIAEQEAPDIQIAKTRLSNDYWQYQSYLANFKPQMNLNATFPNLTRAIDAITLPDGSDAFISRSLMRNNLNLTLSQDIALTGGNIFVRTGMQRIDIFETDNNPGSLSYLSTPISIGFQQPIFGFNPLRWERIIQPLAYEEAQKTYSEDRADVAFQAAGLYFDVLIAQINVDAAIRDKADADTLYEISQGRFNVGKIAETELLQIELNARNADANLAQSQFNLQNSTEELRDFLGIQQAVFFELTVPEELPALDIDIDQALAFARQNRSVNVSFQRRLKEAERQVDQAEGETGLNMDLFASFGLSQTGGTIGEAYNNPLDQQQLTLNLTVPIANWGRDQARREIARSNQAVTQLLVQQERINFEREIVVKVQQYEQVRQQVFLAERSYEIARKRLNITRQRYRIGKIGVTELNLAISEEANARRSYVNALQDFWLAYYDLRRITLYDFRNQESLVVPVEQQR